MEYDFKKITAEIISSLQNIKKNESVFEIGEAIGVAVKNEVDNSSWFFSKTLLIDGISSGISFSDNTGKRFDDLNSLHKIVFKITEIKSGWINYTIKLGQQEFSQSFSHVFDPLHDLKNWLKAITTDVQQTSFEYDAEGKNFKFGIIKCVNNDDYKFGIYDPDSNFVYMEGLVDSKQLVSAFYKEFTSVIISEKFNLNEWEKITFFDYLCQKLDLDINNIEEHLRTVNYKDFLKIITIYEQSEYFEGKKKDFDRLSRDKKLEHIISSSKYNYGYNGMKLKYFKSKIIEEYIKEI